MSRSAREPEEEEEVGAPGAEAAGGLFSLRCPRFGHPAELRLESVSGSVRSCSCSIPGPDDLLRRRCQAACAPRVLGGR